MTTLLLDLELARRIELAEAHAAVDCAKALEGLRPEAGAGVQAVAGGFAVYCGAESPVTQAVGLGLHGPVSEQEFDRLEEFYRSRKETVRVESCPLADASLIRQFGERGYRVTEFSNVMALSLQGVGFQDGSAAGVAIELVGDGQMDLWTLTVAQGFSENFPVSQGILEVMKLFASGSGVESYLARLDGEVAGGGTLALRGSVAGLFGASTLPAFRGRGVQTALLRRRLRRAVERGCNLAVCLAAPGSISQRNAMRQGFSALYTRVKFERGWA